MKTAISLRAAFIIVSLAVVITALIVSDIVYGCGVV